MLICSYNTKLRTVAEKIVSGITVVSSIGRSYIIVALIL